MKRYRVRATCVQTYTQFYTVEARDELEAIDLVKKGEAPLTFERFEDVEEFHPTHAYPARDNTDLQTPLAPCTAYVVPQIPPQPDKNKTHPMSRVA